MRKAFTLIELLVVIAIIAILAAILFPVFAQAKDAAKKTQGLNNVKQIGTGMHLYIQDYDDVTPSTYIINGQGVDIYQHFQPYVKNMDIFFSPVWQRNVPSGQPQSCDNFSTPAGFFVPNEQNRSRCLGYGYNWGFGIWAGGALVGPQQNLSAGNSVLPGVSATASEDPAQLAAFGDTYNGRRYTISAIGSILTHYDGPTRNSGLRHGGMFNFSFLDGHAKAFKMQGFTFNPAANPRGAGYVAIPANDAIRSQFYCMTADTQVVPANLGIPAPNMGCRQFIDLTMSGAFAPLTRWPN
ncbi:MAG: prepilin-type N-terminal cleavage/methylation domain-containing protein [Fimbriimonadaceae bacterium]|nr:prepilin-type N-terminal cleavage/methylation domain-containing protein [Fimbriimonadaceae bacterium]